MRIRKLSGVVSCGVVAAALFACGTTGRAQSRAAGVELPPVEHFSVSMADTTVDPCTDFFKYACNKWNKANPIPADQPAWGTFNQLAIWNLSALHATLEKAAVKSDTRTSAEQKAGDYYAACMDEATVDKLGIAPMQPVLEKIAQLKDKGQLPELMSYLHQRLRPADLIFTDVQYAGVLFGIYAQPDFDDASMMDAALDQSGMGLPAREFYLKDDDKSKTIREQYVAHIALILELSGETKEKAAADAKSVMAFETVLAKSAMDIVMRRDPKNQNNKMTLQQLQALTPGFNWATYLKAMGAPSVPQYLVLAPDFFRGIQSLIADQPVEVWRAYLRYTMVNQMAGFLSKPFVDENFAFYGHTLNGSPQIAPRWRRCSRNADLDLGDAVGQAYVAEYFSAESKARMLKLVAALETALGQDIDSIDWMSASTKKLAHEKLAAQVDKIGYPNKWRDYSTVEIKRDDFVGNIQRAGRYEIDRRMALIGKPADRQIWGMTPPTVNAYEDAPTNTINFPAGILQPPFFDASAIDAVNFGAIGVVIGHEIIHGYDDQGRKFDAKGNLRDWWGPEDTAKYDERGKCISDEYTQEIPELGVKTNGKLTQGEDTADNGGIHIAMQALKNTLATQGLTLDSPAQGGDTQLQTFFLSYANVWCGATRAEAERTRILTQGHSMNSLRVNNVVGNMSEFAHAFGCKKGQPMVHENACRVW